jgi:hypothetical protein
MVSIEKIWSTNQKKYGQANYQLGSPASSQSLYTDKTITLTQVLEEKVTMNAAPDFTQIKLSRPRLYTDKTITPQTLHR